MTPAERLLRAIKDSKDHELVTRAAPRWAWEVIDETLMMDSESTAFDRHLREQIKQAFMAMILELDQEEAHTRNE